MSCLVVNLSRSRAWVAHSIASNLSTNLKREENFHRGFILSLKYFYHVSCTDLRYWCHSPYSPAEHTASLVQPQAMFGSAGCSAHTVLRQPCHRLIPCLTSLSAKLTKVIAAAGVHLSCLCQHQGMSPSSNNQADPDIKTQDRYDNTDLQLHGSRLCQAKAHCDLT